MSKTLQDLTRQLLALSKSAAEEKVLPQEIQLIQEKAFKVQEEMMQLLAQQEEDMLLMPTFSLMPHPSVFSV